MSRLPLATLLLVLVPAGLRAEDRYFDASGIRIRYLVEGKGEPVVLVHGFTAGVEIQWGLPGTIKELAKNYRVIVLDCRGHGKSEKPHDVKKYGLEMVEDVVRLLDHLKIQKAHVVGYSMGALITAKLMVLHPDRLLSATLGGAGALLEDSDTRFIEALGDSLDKGKGFGPLLVALTPPGEPPPSEEEIQAINQMISLMNDVKALAAVVRSFKALAITKAQAKEVRVPVASIIGDRDPLKKGVDELKALQPSLDVVLIKGGDHITTFSSPEFIRAIRAVLARHSPKQEPAGANP